jgi:hypothetical protein
MQDAVAMHWKRLSGEESMRAKIAADPKDGGINPL